MNYKVISQPEDVLLGLAQLREHLRVGSGDAAHPDDALIRRLEKSARAWAENVTGLALVPQTWEVAANEWPATGLDLPGGRVASVLKVTYVNAFGTTVDLDAAMYYVDDFETPEKIFWSAITMPTLAPRRNAVRAQYRVGAGEVAPDILAAVALMVGHLYENREATGASASGAELRMLPEGARALLAPYRVNMGV